MLYEVITQYLLQKAHLVADGAVGDGELVGRAGKAQVPRGGLEGAQGIQVKGAAAHDGGLM